MEMNETKSGDVIILSLIGELMGGDEAKKFQERIYSAIKNEEVHFILDMCEVKWMNSSGLGMIMGALTTLRSSGGDLKLACVSDRVRRPIIVTKLDSVLKMYLTADEAVKSYELGG